MALLRLPPVVRLNAVMATHRQLQSNIAWLQRARIDHPRALSSSPPRLKEQPSPPDATQAEEAASAAASASSPSPKPKPTSPDNVKDEEQKRWEDDPDWNITAFSQLPYATFGYNQHMRINADFKESLRQMLWQFRAPIRYAIAYGSGVFAQTDPNAPPTPPNLSPHPNPPEAIVKWQKGGGKMIDFIFGVSHTQHWHSLNLHQHRDHYSFLGSLGSGAVSRVQDKFGAGVYFNPYITLNGTLVKYGVVNLDTLTDDLSTWSTLYLAGRLHKPVKILRDDPRVRLANQINLLGAVRTALLLLPESFTEADLYTAIASLSYTGDPRMSPALAAEHPSKVRNIVTRQLPNFRQLYAPLIRDLPNLTWTGEGLWPPPDDVLAQEAVAGGAADAPDVRLAQDLDPNRRANMVRRLPRCLRERVYAAYQAKWRMGRAEYEALLAETRDEDPAGFRRREAGEVDRRVAAEADLPDVVRRAVYQTVMWPATVQSVKSFFTAGWGRSMRYMREKREKGRQGK
ncbi:mitochondrial matrix Mmp37 [Trichodelitschia bisporula]|uniref:Phosphatidate cytidylyltransferase, mitochondrial n=1 Tax=Trichodelitschia bisporula TaxID=703511 RepID=A0A6G1I6U8_9PEZI|nr:mitochondrial matrix Mmp37 [Trichodelitschia bisporula]